MFSFELFAPKLKTQNSKLFGDKMDKKDVKFIEHFENKVKDTLQKHKLADKKEKILVGCSGGKDSTTVLYLLQKFGYNVEAFSINLRIGEWSEKNLENVKKFCKEHKIKLHLVDIRDEFGGSICFIRSNIQSKTKLKNCTICGVIKRYLLNKKSREFKAKALATGHSLNDEAENVLMNFLRGNLRLGLGLGPRTGIIKDKKFVTRIKPLYFCSSDEVRRYSELMKFPVLYQPCPCSEGAFRRDIRNKLVEMDKTGEIRRNLVNNFLGFLPKLRKHYANTQELKYCKTCGEPARNEVCRTCELISIMRK